MPRLETTVVHVKKAPYDYYIGRAHAGLAESIWGNPFHVGADGTRMEVIARYRAWVLTQAHLMRRIPTLFGTRLGCWCHPQACHGDVLADLALTWSRSPVYAGVGSRETPKSVLAEMREMAGWLGEQGYKLRSGGAEGADTAFEIGAAGHPKTIYLPFPGFNGHTGPVYPLSDEAVELAAAHHKKWADLSRKARQLHARNTYQVFGLHLNAPARFILAWTPDGCESHETRSKDTGGTGMAIELASTHGIPVINMANASWRQRLDRVLQNQPDPGAQLSLF